MKKNKIWAVILILLLVGFIFGCEKDYTKEVHDFITEYIHMVSYEHAIHKTHITENMKGYFYDYEDKENAEYPEFMLPGGFRDNILVVKDFVIQKIEKLPYTGTKGYFGNGLDGYSVEVQFTIYDESKEKGEYVKKLGYWVALANNKFYIYADDTLNDIYILEKDLEN